MSVHFIGIEVAHVIGGTPGSKCRVANALIARVDGYCGLKSAIIDHKAWRSGNPDMPHEFADQLASYQSSRRHAN